VIAPTVAEHLPVVIAATAKGARRTYSTYSTYRDRILAAFGDRRLDEVRVTDIEILMHDVVANAVIRHNTRGGVYAAEHLLAALRAIYTRAVADNLIPPHLDPAARVRKPRRPPTNRRDLTGDELAAINHAAACSGDDVALDSLILRLHSETAMPARRGGVVAAERPRREVVPGPAAREEQQHPLATRHPHPGRCARRAPKSPRHRRARRAAPAVQSRR
jgi:hypothetical protein